MSEKIKKSKYMRARLGFIIVDFRKDGRLPTMTLKIYVYYVHLLQK